MGQSHSCKTVEGCCRQHVFPDRASDTVKVDLSLLQLPPHSPPEIGNKENEQHSASHRSRDAETSQALEEKVCPQAPALPTEAVAAFKSWEAGWLGPTSVQQEPAAAQCPQFARTSSVDPAVRCPQLAAPVGPPVEHWVEASMLAASRSASMADSAAGLACRDKADHSQNSEAAAATTPFAQQMAQFRLPDETTPVLTGLLEGIPPLEFKAEPPSIDNAANADDIMISNSYSLRSPASAKGEASEFQSPTTPTTTTGRSPAGSPSAHRLGSPALSSGCQTASRDMSPLNAGGVQSPSQEARMQQAQLLLAKMLTSPRGGEAGYSKRNRSEPPLPPARAAVPRGGSHEKRPSRRCLSCKPGGSVEKEAPRLQRLNGCMPQFPSADVTSSEQQALSHKRKSSAKREMPAAG